MKKFYLTINDSSYVVGIEELEGEPSTTSLHTTTARLTTPTVKSSAAPAVKAAPKAKEAKPEAAATGAASVKAPMPGKIISVAVSAGQSVKRGEVLLILEAMKMENEISSPVDGTVTAVNASAGQSVKPGEVLVVIG